MDAEQIRQLEPKLDRFLERFADCFARKDTRAHLGVYVRGQLSNLPEKSVEPIALEAGVAPRTLQEFLSQLKWDELRLRDRVQQVVLTEHAGAHSIGIFDETSDPKKGDKTPGVQKQWCGRLGKLENCIVTVHLGYAVDDFDWLTFDEGYGGKPELLREVTARQQRYVAEVPRSFTGWLKAPRVVTRPYHRGRRGRGRNVPRLASGSRPVRRVDALLKDRALRDQPWQRWRVKDGDKGPMVWECKHTFLTVKDANGLPGQRLHLVIARNVLDAEEIKFFVSNGPPATGVGTLLLVAFSRWRVERCCEDQKSEIGLDQYEGRRYRGLKRHLVLSAISYLFRAKVRQEGGGKSGVDGVPTAHSPGGAGAVLVG